MLTFSEQFLMNDFLPRVPRAKWDGWFFIGIFPDGFVKFQIYHAAFSKKAFSLASAEGMQESEALFMLGGKQQPFVHRAPFGSKELTVSDDPFCVSVEGFNLKHSGVKIETQEVSCAFNFTPAYRLPWLSLKNFLTYAGCHGAAEGQIVIHGNKCDVRGLGILEHAYGWASRLNPRSFVKGLWHWDVVSFAGNKHAGLEDAVAGLFISPIRSMGLPLRGFGKFPSEPPEKLNGLSVKYLESSVSQKTKLAYPMRWQGTMKGSSGTFTYEASALAEPIGGIPDGGFMGFRYEGTYRKKDGRTFASSGTGFTEYASPGGAFARIAKGQVHFN